MTHIRYRSCPECGEKLGWVVAKCDGCDESKFACPNCRFQWRPDRPPEREGHIPAVGWEMDILEAAETGGQEAVARVLERIKKGHGGNAEGPP